METTTQERVTLELRDREPNARERGEDPRYERHYYTATLRYAGRRASWVYSTGSGWTTDPTARDVLESVLLEAGTLEEYDGPEELERAYQVPPAEARRLWSAISRSAERLERLLGDDYERATSDPQGFAWSVTDDPPENRLAWTQSGRVDWSARVGLTDELEPVRVHVQVDEHEHGEETHTRVSFTAETPHSAGQILETLERVTTPAPGWTLELLAELVGYWRRWHLNDMRAGCEHQRAIEAHDGTRPELREPCPVCGYEYGTAWLYEAPPAELLERLEAIGRETGARAE